MNQKRHRSILHIDMDAFFAAVEQRDFPALQGKPVAVGGHGQRGVVAAASYEARPYGVRSAMSMSEALRRCPQLIVQPGRMEVYQEVSAKVFALFERYTDQIEPLSIDEAFLDVTGSLRLFHSARQIGQQLRQAIREEVQLSASVGIAPNKFLAKLCSEAAKPDGLYALAPDEVDAFLVPLPVGSLWGVGPKSVEILHRFGVKTVHDLRGCSEDWLKKRLGEWGATLYALCRGQDPRPVQPRGGPKSIGHEETFARDIWDPDEIERELLRLAEKVGRRLRKKGVSGRTVSIKVRYGNFETRTCSKTEAHGTDRGLSIFAVAKSLLHKTDAGRRGLRLLGLTVSGFVDSPPQPDLFETQEPSAEALDKTLDRLHQRFGDKGVIRGTLIGRNRK